MPLKYRVEVDQRYANGFEYRESDSSRLEDGDIKRHDVEVMGRRNVYIYTYSNIILLAP